MALKYFFGHTQDNRRDVKIKLKFMRTTNTYILLEFHENDVWRIISMGLKLFTLH